MIIHPQPQAVRSLSQEVATLLSVTSDRITITHTPHKVVEVLLDGREIPAVNQPVINTWAKALLA